MEKWTLIEAQSQHCTKSVVGSIKRYYPIDALQHEWTKWDAQAGRCSAEEVGTSRFPPHAPLVPPAGYEIPDIEELDDAEGQGPTTDWIRAAFNGMGGRKAFVAYCKKNPAQMWPLLLKGGLAQFLKEEPAAKNLDELTLTDMQELSSAEIKLLLLKSEGITTKSQVSALKQTE